MTTITTPDIETGIIEQVNNAKKEFITDGYSMSIGELISMYREGEIIINPDFQRAFRWTLSQQTRLIESILMGVPLPSIFVYQNEDRKWEVVDGVQRLSTIFQFVGVLKDDKGEVLPATVLEKTKYLPFLEGMTWEALPYKLQLDFKRDSRIEVKIIRYLSDASAKFEVFQRLNWAAVLSGQEYRNALLVMINKKVYNWLIELSEDENYQTCVSLSDKLVEEKYNQDLVLRLFIFSLFEYKKGKVDSFIDECIFYQENNFLTQIADGKFDLVVEKRKFQKTFELLKEAKGAGVFQKENEGRLFLQSYYEAIAIGLYNNIESYSIEDIELISNKINELESQTGFIKYKGGRSGTNSEARIKNVVPFGKQYFNKNGKNK